MTLNLLTLVLNGEPFIESHLPVFEQLAALGIPWKWSIAEGQAANVACTRWCKRLPPALSTDGTKEYLDSLHGDPRISVIRKPYWKGGKLEMVKEASRAFRRPGVLMQIDSDECWTAPVLNSICRLFRAVPNIARAYFKCRYWVGPNLAIVPETDPQNRWLRAWRYEPGMTWNSHEPPMLNRNRGNALSEHDTSRMGLSFEHYSLATEAQAAYKLKFYGYKTAVEGWRRLQANRHWPAKLKPFFPWMSDSVAAAPVSAVAPGEAAQCSEACSALASPKSHT